MRIVGSYTLPVARQEVWDALHDPAVLARTLPGCQALEVTGTDQYAVTVQAGVASIKGTYQGRVALSGKEPPERYVMDASGQGGPGTIDARVAVELDDVHGGTRVRYDVDAVVGGTIAGVGQRVLQGASKKTAEEFFAAVEAELTGAPAVAAPTPAAEEPAGPPEVGTVFRPPAKERAGADTTELALALVLGAVIALLGVLVGRRIAKRS